MTPLTRISIALATLALGLPALAAAKGPITIAPPGDSAVSQYVEVVPGDTGASPTRVGGGQAGAITSGQRAQLDRLGANGRTLAAVVDATAPQPIFASDGPAGTAAPDGPGRTATSDRRAGTAASGEAGRPSASPGAGALPGALTGTDAFSVLSNAEARSTPSLILDAAAGSGTSGLGIFLPAMMLACALGVIARAVRRRRSRL
jgi:hypothetical protein